MSLAKPNKIQIIKYAPPPPDLPILGAVPADEVSFIGRTNYVASLEEKKFIFGINCIIRNLKSLSNFLDFSRLCRTLFIKRAK